VVEQNLMITSKLLAVVISLRLMSHGCNQFVFVSVKSLRIS